MDRGGITRKFHIADPRAETLFTSTRARSASVRASLHAGTLEKLVSGLFSQKCSYTSRKAPYLSSDEDSYRRAVSKSCGRVGRLRRECAKLFHNIDAKLLFMQRGVDL